MTHRIRVLGQIATTTAQGAEVPLTRRREREVLALLVAARGRPVSTDRLLAEVWQDDGSGPACVQVAISRLRALLDPTRTGQREVHSSPAGYALVLESGRVDVWSFEDLAEQALSASTPSDRLVLGTQADELWAGEAYAECRSPSLQSESARLAELRVTVQEARAEALLALGHPAAGVRLLAPVAPEHPYREQLWALLARAHYACARQAEALATIATLRARLAEDLGVDPSAMVRATEQAILSQDPGLTRPAAAQAARHRRTRIVRRCRAVSVGHDLRHTPLVRAGTTGTMTG
jgi:DNA-binding SARP family transcriptional activator